jgi:hypothetical protein
MTLTAFQ